MRQPRIAHGLCGGRRDRALPAGDEGGSNRTRLPRHAAGDQHLQATAHAGQPQARAWRWRGQNAHRPQRHAGAADAIKPGAAGQIITARHRHARWRGQQRARRDDGASGDLWLLTAQAQAQTLCAAGQAVASGRHQHQALITKGQRFGTFHTGGDGGEHPPGQHRMMIQGDAQFGDAQAGQQQQRHPGQRPQPGQ